ncbi:hypothetical protein QJS04_geneDACA015070 [Acorus gramineus]|uniref:Reverse transcriptase zinc-binding domain-containing protein n=1 Tax=Acorus gramineus TaxID=55184 RepID=A0AAV9BS95_ACOGR|nr:hypothetical protein QJS04_geneDACA015070 [Acorus gramineus]
MVWKPKPCEGFTVKSSYWWLRQERVVIDATARKAKEIWFFKFPTKVKAFLWTLYLRKILIKTRRASWALTGDLNCVFCHAERETVCHLMVSCPLVKQVWEWLGVATGLQPGFFTLDEMWEAGKRLRQNGDSKAAKITQSSVPAVVRSVWRARNQALFKGITPYTENIWEDMILHIQDWPIGADHAPR